MMHTTEYPTNLVDEVSFLPSVEQFSLNTKGLYVVKGLTENLAEQLVEQSKDPLIAEFCPNDAPKRFKSVEAVAAWQTKQRLSLPLVKMVGDSGLQLTGFGWMGPGKPGSDEPQIDGATTTFAVRIYPAARGDRNALPYTRAIVEAHDQEHGSDGVWLEAWGDNTAAVGTYAKAGFQEVARVLGVRGGEPRDRVYMTLGSLSAAEA